MSCADGATGTTSCAIGIDCMDGVDGKLALTVGRAVNGDRIDCVVEKPVSCADGATGITSCAISIDCMDGVDGKLALTVVTDGNDSDACGYQLQCSRR